MPMTFLSRQAMWGMVSTCRRPATFTADMAESARIRPMGESEKVIISTPAAFRAAAASIILASFPSWGGSSSAITTFSPE